VAKRAARPEHPGRPLTRARSPWVEVEGEHEIAGVRARVWRRNVGDGRLAAICALEPDGWHLSISHAGHGSRLVRYPTWDEIADARYALLPPDITVAMFLPPPGEYVALHDTTFHLHEVDHERK
jgi:hypothetical protein